MDPHSALEDRTERLRYAYRIAFDLAPKLPNLELDVIFQAAQKGLSQAELRFDPARGVKFTTFAKYHIRGAVLDLARQERNRGLTGYGSGRRGAGKRRGIPRLEAVWDSGPRTESRYIDDPGARMDEWQIVAAVQQAISLLPEPMRELADLQYLQEISGRRIMQMMHISGIHFRRLRNELLELLRNNDRLQRIVMNTQTRIDRVLLKSEVDETGEVQDRIRRYEEAQSFKAYEDDLKREKELKLKLATYLPKDLKGEETTTLEGNRWIVNISAARNERFVIDGGYKKILGWLKDRFYLKCSIPMKYLDCELSEEQQAEVIRKGHVGYRSYSTERLRREKKQAA